MLVSVALKITLWYKRGKSKIDQKRWPIWVEAFQDNYRKRGSSMKVASNFHWIHLRHGSNGNENIFKPREATYIAKIAGGWLLKSMHFFGRSSSMTTQAMAFVPDASHKWQYDQESQGWQRLSQKSTVNYGDVTDKLEVWHGCIYRNSFFNANKEMHISLIFVAEEEQ